MLNFFIRRKRIKLFANRPRLKAINDCLKRAAEEQDVAWVEELMEEKRQLTYELLNIRS